jgi:hypothetical protein
MAIVPQADGTLWLGCLEGVARLSPTAAEAVAARRPLGEGGR